MIALSAKIRSDFGRKVKILRKKGILPAVLYGPKIKPLPLEVDLKEFEKIYKEAGETSLISLGVDGKSFLVLIHDVAKDPISDVFLHVDFYQPNLEEEVQAKVPLVFEGSSSAVKELGGTLVHNISELEVKALPEHLPKEIRVDISKLKTFEDHIFIRDLKVSEGVRILKNPDEIVASVIPPEKIEEELAKPLEEKIEEIEKVESKKKKEEEELS